MGSKRTIWQKQYFKQCQQKIHNNNLYKICIYCRVNSSALLFLFLTLTNLHVFLFIWINTCKKYKVKHLFLFGFYLLLFLSLMCPPGSRIWPFFSQVSWGSGSPCAWQVKMAVVPTGRAMDWGGWTNSAGAERGKKLVRQICWKWKWERKNLRVS